MPTNKVLICGAGIAGSVLAFWLARNGFEVVVIERAKAESKIGQGLEIESPALKIVKAMGIIDKLQERRTGETGFRLEDSQSRSYGSLEIGGFSPTGALELMRGDLTEVLYKSADESPNVTYRFETSLQSLSQSQDRVTVHLEDKRNGAIVVEDFDFVVGADGVKSRTRQIIMGSIQKLDCFKQVGAFVSYFSIPKEDHDWPYSRLCHFPGRRLVWIRPTRKESKVTSAYLIHVGGDAPALRQANAANNRLKQKEGFAEIYSGLGWETPRVVREMMKADNFYSDELVQVKLPTWSQDRVVLLGDAAWAPSPFTGQGNQLAIIGAWVLAQEMSRNRSPVAYEMYEKRLRKYVEECQSIPLNGYAPYIFNPQTAFGIWLLRWIFLIFVWINPIFSRLNLGKWLPAPWEEQFDLEIDQIEAEKIR